MLGRIIEIRVFRRGTVELRYADPVGQLWLRVRDVAALIPQELKPTTLARRYPRGCTRANPAIDAWYLTRETLSAVAAREYAEQSSRLLAWFDREVLGAKGDDPVQCLAVRPIRNARLEPQPNWIIRHWRGQLGLITSVFGSGGLVGALALLAHLSVGVDDITKYYRLAAIQYLLFVSGTAIVLYWWGRGVIYSAQRWVAADRSIVVALLAMATGIGAVGFSASQIIDRERQYLLTEFLTIVRDADPKATVELFETGRVIVIRGEMGFGTTNRLRALLAENPRVRLVALTSRGGREAEGFALMHEIADRKLNTLAWEKCMSACTAAYLGGVQRFATEETQFGFHRAGFHWEEDVGDLREGDDKLVAQMRDLGIDERFIARSVEHSIHGMYKPPVHDAAAAGVVTEVWR